MDKIKEEIKYETELLRLVWATAVVTIGDRSVFCSERRQPCGLPWQEWGFSLHWLLLCQCFTNTERCGHS
jgi:hypothetical protein